MGWRCDAMRCDGQADALAMGKPMGWRCAGDGLAMGKPMRWRWAGDGLAMRCDAMRWTSRCAGDGQADGQKKRRGMHPAPLSLFSRYGLDGDHHNQHERHSAEINPMNNGHSKPHNANQQASKAANVSASRNKARIDPLPIMLPPHGAQSHRLCACLCHARGSQQWHHASARIGHNHRNLHHRELWQGKRQLCALLA